jgi:putative addiction module killer protein
VIEVRQYVDRLGRTPFQDWFLAIDETARARISIYIDRLGRGNFSAVKGVGAGVFELRIDLGPGFRVYFGKDGERIVILPGGGTKKRQQVDIARAHALWQQYKQEKRED